MSETTSPTPGACAEYRAELPLLAVGALDTDRAALLKKHLDGCAECHASFTSHCRVLELVKNESAPDRPLDTERILARLRERMGQADGPAAGGTEKVRPFKLFLSIALILIGVVALLVFARPRDPTPSLLPPESPEIALVYASKRPGGREVKSGATVNAEDGGARLRFSKVEVRLKDGGQLRVMENGIELLAGAVAVNVPKDSTFTVSVPAAAARVRATTEARFAVEVHTPGRASVSVVEGDVTLEHAGGQTLIPAGRQGQATTKGLVGELIAADPRTALSWLSQELYKGLKLELSVLRPARVSLLVKNTSNGPVGVTGYHPLGVNYQLEIRRPGSTSPEFVKLVPSLLRVQRAPGVIEAVRETLGQIVIEPGQAFELEMDLASMLSEPGTYRIAAEYLGFGPSGESAAELGLLLRSNEAKIVITAPQPGQPKKK